MFPELPYKAHFRSMSACGHSQPGPSSALAGTSGRMVSPPRARDPFGMTKRVVAAFLWFYTGWYAGAMIAAFLGVNPVFGPILGAAAAGFCIGDPFHVMWARSPKAEPVPTTGESAPEAA